MLIFPTVDPEPHADHRTFLNQLQLFNDALSNIIVHPQNPLIVNHEALPLRPGQA